MSAYTDNAYEVLGVKSNATEKEIKTAYRKLALIHHPDRQTDPADREKANTRFAAIANAYEIISDQYLRSEYDNCNPSRKNTGTACVDPFKQKTGGFQPAHNDKPPEPFRYHFSDPYEVFKRDFRDQFGIDYPGAQYDWIDFDEPSVPTNRIGTPAAIANGGGETRVHNNGRSNNAHSLENHISKVGDGNKKKITFNPFRRNNKKKNDDVKEQQLVVHATSNSGSYAATNPSSSCNAVVPSNGAMTNPSSDNSTALVKVEKKNNRPVSMDVQTTKKGKVTTTKTTMVRPDGTVETVTMKTGLPGPGKKKPLHQLTNGTEKVLQLTNGTGKAPQITNGTGTAPKLTNGKGKVHQITNGERGKQKMLQSNGQDTTARLTNGGSTKPSMMLANEAHSSKSKPKHKMLGWGGSKQ